MDALIGYTGFVGSNLCRDDRFDLFYNSKNVHEMKGRHFGRVVCAGVSAVKWWANANPDEDRAGIRSLTECLDTITADQFTLISTIDVYRNPVGVTEQDRPSAEGLHAYGLHRLALEEYVADRFPRHSIVRLPALFGPNLKKNAVYDLLHDNRIEVINPAGSFQWYPVVRLAADLRRIEEGGPTLVNIATEPVTMAAIGERFFPGKTMGAEAAGPAASYDMRTVHDALLGGHGGYHMDAAAVLDALGAFIASERAA